MPKTEVKVNGNVFINVIVAKQTFNLYALF